MTKGTLYLAPTLLGQAAVESSLPFTNVVILKDIRTFIVENLRSARRFLRKADREFDIDSSTFYLIDKHTNSSIYSSYLSAAMKGNHIALLSEAGCPGVADPGAEVIKLAHEKGITVKPMVGPSSILLALMASGFNGQNFVFHGYLPVKTPARNASIKQLEAATKKGRQTQIFIEAPYRNQYLLEAILEQCHSSTLLCLATDLTLNSEFLQTKTVGEWKKKVPNINKRPTVFLLG